MKPSGRMGGAWQAVRSRSREIALIVVLLLVNYLIFSRLILLVRSSEEPVPTATRTPKPTFTPSELLSYTPTPLAERTPTLEVVPEPTPTQIIHIVQAGETLSEIARTYDTTADAIAQANGLSDANALREGQELLIPPPAPPAPTGEASPAAVPTQSSTVGQRIHVVQEGETVSGIARKYGVTAADIIQANGLDDPNAISVGQALVIP
jgi:LysM repeat protein